MRKLIALGSGVALMLALQTGGVAAHHGCEYDCSTTQSTSSTETTSSSTESSSTTETTTSETSETTTTITESTTTTETTKATPRPTTTPPSTATDAPRDSGDSQGLWGLALGLAAVGGLAVLFAPKKMRP